MTYQVWKTLFTQNYSKFKLPKGATECGPFLRPTIHPNLPPWKLFWCIIYPDQQYIRIVEYYDVDTVLSRKGGVRVQFCFHYGPLAKGRDKKYGCPKIHKKTHIRFDLSTDQYVDHLHYLGEDHIPQDRMVGCKILDMEPFRFIQGIEAHRNSHKPLSLHECFGFEIKTV
jgi:hypothetical protein